jgi:Flp pilus assembly pilin Flp
MGVFILRTWLEAKFINSDRGAAMVEYGFLLALIAIIAISAVTLFGGKVSEKFSSIASNVG